MIKTKEELKIYLAEDLKRLGVREPGIKSRFLHNEFWYIWRYIKLLRTLEFYENNRNKNIFYKLHWLYLVRKHKKESIKTGFYAFPNTIAPGFAIFHVGEVRISKHAQIGKNFTIRPGCVIGNVNHEANGAIIEDNVEFSLGVKVFGPIRIGRGAIINGNSTIMHNIPPYAIATGNPAKVIGFRMEPEQIVEYEKKMYSEENRIPLEKLKKNYEKFYLKKIKEITKFVTL